MPASLPLSVSRRHLVLPVALSTAMLFPSMPLWAGEPEGSDPPASAQKGEREAAKRPRVDPANRKLVLAGNFVTGAGGIAFLTMAAGLVVRGTAKSQLDHPASEMEGDSYREEQRRNLRIGNGLAIGGGIGAVVLFSVGIALMATGYKRERARRQKMSHHFSPTFDRGEAGATVGGSWKIRF